MDLLKLLSNFPTWSLYIMASGFLIFALGAVLGFVAPKEGLPSASQVVPKNFANTQSLQQSGSGNSQVITNNFYNENNQTKSATTLYDFEAVKHPFSLPSNTKLSMITPIEDQIIEQQTFVTIRTENLPSEYKRWLLIYAPGIKKWYPYEVIKNTPEITEGIRVGSDNDYGSSFKIILFITDEKGDEYLRSQSDGTTKLPRGQSIFATVQRAAKK